MTESTSRSPRKLLGCVVKAVFALTVLATLGCAGLVGGVYVAYFNGIYAPAEADSRVLAIRGGTLFDGTETAPRQGITLVIEDGVITCAKRGCGVPVGARVLDAKGQAVLPGLTDLHVHFGAPVGDATNPATMIWDYMRHRPGVREQLIAAGVTTIRSVGDDANFLPNTQAALQDGTLLGPTIYAVGPIFTAPGGHPAGTIYRDMPWLIDSGTRQVDDEATARAEVRAVVEAGFTGIKLVYDDVEGRVPKLSQPVMEAIVSEANALGVWTAAHTGTAADVRDVVSAGVTTIEHGARDPIDPDTLAQMADASVVFVPTLAVIEAMLPDALEGFQANAKAAFDAGVRIGVGSDTQGPRMAFGTSTHREIELLMAAGIPGTDALRGATTVAAQALGQRASIGTLAEGQRADVILVGGLPWDDARALEDVRGVILNGQLVYSRAGP